MSAMITSGDAFLALEDGERNARPLGHSVLGTSMTLSGDGDVDPLSLASHCDDPMTLASLAMQFFDSPESGGGGRGGVCTSETNNDALPVPVPPLPRRSSDNHQLPGFDFDASPWTSMSPTTPTTSSKADAGVSAATSTASSACSPPSFGSSPPSQSPTALYAPAMQAAPRATTSSTAPVPLMQPFTAIPVLHSSPETRSPVSSAAASPTSDRTPEQGSEGAPTKARPKKRTKSVASVPRVDSPWVLTQEQVLSWTLDQVEERLNEARHHKPRLDKAVLKELRRQRRLIHGREYSRRKRKVKQAAQYSVENHVAALQQENTSLHARVGALQAENAMLREMLGLKGQALPQSNAEAASTTHAGGFANMVPFFPTVLGANSGGSRTTARGVFLCMIVLSMGLFVAFGPLSSSLGLARPGTVQGFTTGRTLLEVPRQQAWWSAHNVWLHVRDAIALRWLLGESSGGGGSVESDVRGGAAVDGSNGSSIASLHPLLNQCPRQPLPLSCLCA